MDRLANKVAIITGAGSGTGMGAETARLFAREGARVVVTDLHSRNGTTIVLPSGETQKLRGGEPTPVILGTVVDLGGGVELRLEEL